MASQANLTLSLDIAPVGQGLAVDFDAFSATINVPNTGGGTFVQATAGTQALGFGAVTAAQVLLVVASAPIELVVTFSAAGAQTLYGTIFLITQPPGTNTITAASVTTLTSATTVNFSLGG